MSRRGVEVSVLLSAHPSDLNVRELPIEFLVLRDFVHRLRIGGHIAIAALPAGPVIHNAWLGPVVRALQT